MSLHLSLVEYLIVLAAAGFGATVQGAVGFGANLTVAPVVALVAPEALPASLMLWVVPLTVAMVMRERHGVDWSGVGWTTLGRLPGTAVGAWIVSAVAPETLSAVCGGVVVLAVVTSSLTATVPLNPASKLAAGVASGAMGTATSIGGPPLALLYQHHGGRVLRSTLAMIFTIGTATSLLALAVSGAVEGWHVRLAVALLPGLASGLVLSRLVIARLDGPWLRPVVLAFAAGAGLLALGRGLAW